MRYKSIYCRFIKVAFDFAFAFLFLLFFCWLFLIIAIAVKINDCHGPVIFSQQRIGKNGRIYRMYKFRTMYEGSENLGSGVYSDDNDERVTKVGLFLRKTSLDELPQLINILKGEMSLIGFRSPLTYHPWKWEEYNEDQKLMFKVKPGMSGWAQVNGRRTVKWDERIRYNCWYANNVSFSIDVKIFFKTIIKILKGENNQNTEKTV